MLSITTESFLADLICAIAENERELEKRRQTLADDPSFAPSSCFLRLDRLSVGYLTPQDIKDFLRDCGAVATTTEVTQLIESLTTRNTLRLYNSNFLDLILPKDPILRSIALRRDLYPSWPLGRSAEFSLSRLIQTAIDGNSRLERSRSSLRLRYDYNAFDAFRTIDKYRMGYINSTDLYVFLQRAGMKRADDPEYFIKALDKDKDGRLSYAEFLEGLTPSFISPSERYPYSEKKPSYRESSYERPVPKTEYRSRRLFSEDRYEAPKEYSSPLGKSYAGGFKESYVSPLKGGYATSYGQMYATPPKKVYASPARDSLATDYTSPSRSYQLSLTKKLDYGGSPSRQKQAEISLSLAMEKQLGYEKRLEKAKEELVPQPDFNLMEGFGFFDCDKKGYITLSEFYDGMKSLGILGNYSDISLLFRRMDDDKDGRVRYSDYYVAIAPKKTEYERIIMGRPPYSSSQLMGFGSMTKILYREVLNLLVEQEQACEMTRQRLRKDLDFDPYDAFSALDLQGKGYVSLGAVL